MQKGPITYGANGLQIDDYVRRWVYRRAARGLDFSVAHKGELMGDVGLYSHRHSCQDGMRKFARRVGLPWPPEMGY